ncbi:uncharacterized protein LOC131525237 [Onychostoma macrolepis]|uniref:uncharacterized protein LOC131525237 n=1 Tax=Onychostoma macrolepis TaxID=369639 RepID=UPI00272DAF39|nr:uncharacterized protein LOC131525237 [Onychostoma macrolepis]
MLRCSNLLLLRCLVNHSGTPLVGTHSSSERGKKGGNIILECELENNKIINLIRRSKSILECQNEKCENKTENVQGICKEGACDIIIKNLSFSDAGTYILRYSHTNDPTEKVQQNEVQTKKYQLHIQDEASVKIGEELKLDVLSNAHKVKHQNKPSTEWTEVWSRSGGVQSERLTDTDGILSINNFTASDAGTYRVLDSEGEILITVTVTERRTESKEGLDGTEQHTVEKWIASVCGILVLAVIVIVITVIIRRRRRRGYTEGQVQENPDPQNIHNKYLDASLAARPHVNGAAILVRATLQNSHTGTEENIPDSAAAWASTDRRTLITTDLGVLSFTANCKQDKASLKES